MSTDREHSTGNEWDDYAAEWDDDPAARAYAAAALDSLLDLVAAEGIALEGAAVCDFGCGTGLLTERLVARVGRVDAVDKSAAMLAVLDAKVDRHGWSAVKTMTAPRSAADAYDLIVCSSVCGFLVDYPGTVASLAATLRPGGLFVQWDWEAAPGDDDGLIRHAISMALVGAGLESVHVDVGFRAEFEGETMAPLMGWGRRPRS